MLLKESGDWHAKANNRNGSSIRTLPRVLSDYKTNGEYLQDVNEALDELFFKRPENNETKLENYYDKLIEKYNNEIGQKALLEKANLLMKQKRYQDILGMQDALAEFHDRFDLKGEKLVYEAANPLRCKRWKKRMSNDDRLNRNL